ncbi:hypothetical protein AA18895_1990 [Acetobacter ghanensis DSM 18895]|nr:hypothetical protein AA18895_1990 [Acetobacter ghanensis DSM 18895]
MVQEELVNIAEAAGIVFDKTKNDQCITAIKQLISGVASSAVMGTPGVLADGDVAGKLLYYAANQKAPVFVYGTTTVALVTTTALGTALQGFLSLGGGNVTGTMDWGSKTAAATLTHRYWSAGAPSEGDATPDVTLTISGGTAGTANKGVTALSTGTFDLTGIGSIPVPDVVDFNSQGVLNAKTADGRYISSVADAAASLKRIISLLENADGRAVFGDGTNNSVLANLSDLPTQFNGVDSSGRGYGYQKFNDGTMIVFGYAYYQKSTGTTGTVITLPFSFPGKFIGLNCTDVGNDNNAVAAYPESQSSFRCWGGAPTISYLNTEFFYTARGTWE